MQRGASLHRDGADPLFLLHKHIDALLTLCITQQVDCGLQQRVIFLGNEVSQESSEKMGTKHEMFARPHIGSGIVSEIIFSALGAIILLLIVRLIRGRGRI